MSQSCPCEYVAPCKPSCTCARPHMSGGCRRCCAYGSDEQRLARARKLVAMEDGFAELMAACSLGLDALVSLQDRDDGSLVSPARNAMNLAVARAKERQG
jgi:hypothetical protein